VRLEPSVAGRGSQEASTMHEDAKPWVERSDYDLATAEAMRREGRDLYVLFCCQQAVEKRLKALLVHQTNQMPVRTHDLLRLAQEVGMQPSAKQRAVLKELTDYYVETRYPENLTAVSSLPQEEVRAYLERTREIVQWCDQQMK
jgi:HEPN domain-containing protein